MESCPELRPTPLLRALDLFLLVGSSDSPPRADPTLLITTRERPHGLTQEGSSSSGLSPQDKATLPFSHKRSASLVHYPLDGRCDSLPLLECTLSTTTPRRRHGTTLDSHLLSTRTCRSTSETSEGSSSTSDRSLLFGQTLVSVT